MFRTDENWSFDLCLSQNVLESAHAEREPWAWANLAEVQNPSNTSHALVWMTPSDAASVATLCHAHAWYEQVLRSVNNFTHKTINNKKVLLRERKRHTARRVAVASACYSGGGTWSTPPDLGWGTPRTWDGVPPRTWDGVTPQTWDWVPPLDLDLGWGTPLPRPEMGYPPQVWTDKQTENSTFPHPSDAGGKYTT